MKNLFIVHTPYHLILACGLCEEINNEEKDILIYKDFNTENLDLNLIKKKFRNVYFYDTKIYKVVDIPKINGLIKSRSKIKNIKKLIQYKYNRIFVFNEVFIETQYIINKRKKSKNSEVIYIEDGTNAYMQTKIGRNSKNIKSIIKNYLYYGFRYEDIGRTFGIHSKITKRKVIWPDIVREEFKQDQVELEEINGNVLKNGINSCYKTLRDEVFDDKNKIFILLEHLEFFSMYQGISLEDYIEIIDNIISTLSDRMIYLKYHPRDNSNYLKDVIDNYSNIKIVENSQPAEIYYISNDISIISVFSTSLLTAAKILPKSNIISLAKIMKINNNTLINKFLSIGINVPKDLTELMDLLN
ncbi:MAG: hypothetical protein SOR73_06695 [Romboutsia timonensis]|uniref:polysialyltransferase family glycosyltransferase n=1 Tax=Romboutsia timonensis TaxID=1776391 RepID=UPI002A75C7C1|nr:polysialyltransferase family glycosyltransferase [Romboutsia timonensis]MDY3001342.1 hypothetical protein [Romboutsia timonensis]